MSKVKAITTVAPVKVAGMEVGSIMQDKDGYFYRAKGGINGPHDWRKDNDHRPTIEDVKQDLPPGATIPQVKAPQERKGASQGQKPQTNPTTAAPGKAAQVKQAQADMQAIKAAQEAPQKAAQAKEPAKPTQSPQAKPQEAPAAPAPQVHAVAFEGLTEAIRAASQSVAGGAPSLVRYKLVQALGDTGPQFWLYPGYNRPQGFKWESLGGVMFLSLDAVGEFLELNGIAVTEEVETVDIRKGSYNPNKGVTPNDDANGQRNLL